MRFFIYEDDPTIRQSAKRQGYLVLSLPEGYIAVSRFDSRPLGMSDSGMISMFRRPLNEEVALAPVRRSEGRNITHLGKTLKAS